MNLFSKPGNFRTQCRLCDFVFAGGLDGAGGGTRGGGSGSSGSSGVRNSGRGGYGTSGGGSSRGGEGENVVEDVRIRGRNKKVPATPVKARNGFRSVDTITPQQRKRDEIQEGLNYKRQRAAEMALMNDEGEQLHTEAVNSQ